MTSRTRRAASRCAGLLLALLPALTAQAQQSRAPAAQPAHATTKKHKPAQHPKAPPVVAARHGKPRKPVHPAAPITTPKPKAAPAPAKAPAARPALPPNVGTVTHLPLPRYVSLRSDEVNMRSGPGERYPVLWLYKRHELPVKIEREFDVWRLVEDMDGIKGWVHAATVTGRRTFVITGTDDVPLRSEAADTSGAVAVLKPGVVGRILACDAGAAWCRVQVGDYRGFLPRASFWGTDAGEAVAP
jgi:SH3-like domain-containing protein